MSGRAAKLGRERMCDSGQGRPRPGHHLFDETERTAVAAREREGRLTRQAFEEDGGQRKDIGARRDSLVSFFVLLGRGVAEARAGQHRRLVRIERRQFGQAKIRDLGDFDAVFGGDENVRRFEVAMDDVLRVNRREGPSHLPEQPAHASYRQPDSALILDDLRQRDPVNELEHREGQVDLVIRVRVRRREPCHAVIVEAHQIGIGVGLGSELPKHLRFALKPAQRVLADAVGAQNLDHDEHAVRLVVVSFVDPTLSPLADEVSQVEAYPVGPLENLPDQLVAQECDTGVGGVHRTQRTPDFPPARRLQRTRPVPSAIVDLSREA